VLVERFLAEMAAQGRPRRRFTPEALAVLEAYQWPGNVRELRNLVERTLAMGEPPALEVTPPGEAAAGLPGPERSYKDARADLLHRFEAQYLAKLMSVTKGNVSAAARHAKMDRSHLIELLQRHGLRSERE
jgi:DNA-binding NtrC family response regulator